MLLKSINKVPLFRKIYTSFGQKWTENKLEFFENLLRTEESILDLGCGNCTIANALINKGYTVTPVDIKDLSILSVLKPIVYDGKKLPFQNETYDTVLLLTVLHHSENPEALLGEAKRVSKRIIIIEDTYANKFQKVITQFMDTLINWGHSKMTYQNKSEEEWEQLFQQLNLAMINKKRKRTLGLFRQTMYEVEC